MKYFLSDSVHYNYQDSKLTILDQTKLPGSEEYIVISEEKQLYDAIYNLKVRGAPAIGIAAAFGLAAMLNKHIQSDLINYLKCFDEISSNLLKTRPTAVNLRNALERMRVVLNQCLSNGVSDPAIINDYLAKEAIKIKDEDIAANLVMAENVLSLLKPGSSVLTYCNAGHLAVSRYGTALSPIYLAHERGEAINVYVCETRPLMQGSRLTCYELKKRGIPFTLICDNMVSHLFSLNKIDAVITGCDRIAKNGDTANKIGTSMVSVVAKYYGIPHYVVGPGSTIDTLSPNGESIEIEYRDGDEITEMWFSERMTPEKINVMNPSFDITKADLISAIITEKGIFRYPYNFTL